MSDRTDRNQTTQDLATENEMLRDAVWRIAEIASYCRHEMQGRLMDGEHQRAFRALGRIVEIVNHVRE